MRSGRLRRIVLCILGAVFLAPSISEVVCSDACVGGACEASSTVTLCDLDTSEECCGGAAPEEEAAPCDASVPRLGSDCQLCPCFTRDRVGDFVVPKARGELDSKHVQAAVAAPLLTSALPAEKLFKVFSPDTKAHGPPLYRRHRALLI